MGIAAHRRRRAANPPPPPSPVPTSISPEQHRQIVQELQNKHAREIDALRAELGGGRRSAPAPEEPKPPVKAKKKKRSGDD